MVSSLSRGLSPGILGFQNPDADTLPATSSWCYSSVWGLGCKSVHQPGKLRQRLKNACTNDGHGQTDTPPWLHGYQGHFPKAAPRCIGIALGRGSWVISLSTRRRRRVRAAASPQFQHSSPLRGADSSSSWDACSTVFARARLAGDHF